MKIKLDENITTAAAALLIQAGHLVDTVADEGLTGATDSVVMESCRTEQRLLLTFDVGFGDVRAYPPGSHHGIVLLRLPDQRPDITLETLTRLLSQHALDDFDGALVVVSGDRVRVRRSEL